MKNFSNSVRTIDRWGACARPHYFSGILAAADQALKENVSDISVLEFGVAGGSGLIEMQTYSETIENQTGVRIHVYGFDTGEGLQETLAKPFKEAEADLQQALSPSPTSSDGASDDASGDASSDATAEPAPLEASPPKQPDTLNGDAENVDT